MIYKYRTFNFMKPLLDVQDGDEFHYCNLNQLFPHTKIFEGKHNLKFIQCAMRNCDPPPDAQLLESCGLKQQNYCSNQHLDWVQFGLPVCTENCEHVVDTDVVQIDGVTVDTVYYYKDKDAA